MTAKRPLALLLSLTLASGLSHAQSPQGKLELSLEPNSPSKPTPSVLETAEVAEAVVHKSPSSEPVVTKAQSPRIERSILETPRISTPTVVSPAKLHTVSQTSTPDQPKPIAITIATNVARGSQTTVSSQVSNATSSELIRQRFPNGQPQIERWVTEDSKGNIVNHGSYIEYDTAGNTHISGNYKLGLRDGVWNQRITTQTIQKLVGPLDKAFTEPFVSQANFKDGQLDGLWTITDGQGKQLIAWHYSADARHGLSLRFNGRGDVTESITYKNNLADGAAKISSGTGEPTSTQFADGLMLKQVDKWHPAVTGKPRMLQSQELHLVPMPHNIASSDWSNSRIEYRATAGIEPIRHGLAVTFYTNGQRESEGNYDYGRRTGTFAWWYPNGQQKTVGDYVNDLEHDAWTWWHENGMKQASGKFVEGQKVSEWSLWSPEGKLVKRTLSEENTQVAGKPRSGEPIQQR